ncbi:hypothetical protein [Taibaiella lutea]|nr:hypothetical protein [Taibaiella lutea]
MEDSKDKKKDKGLKKFFKLLGPGLITGASDDDRPAPNSVLQHCGLLC